MCSKCGLNTFLQKYLMWIRALGLESETDLAGFTNWMSFLHIQLVNGSETNSECKLHRVSEKLFKSYNRSSFLVFSLCNEKNYIA